MSRMPPGQIVSVMVMLMLSPPAAAQLVTFNDNFDDNRNYWGTTDEAAARVSLSRGRYVIEHRRQLDDSWIVWNNARVHEDTDFRVEATFIKVDGVEDFGYGLLLGVQKTQAYLSFLITDKGRFRVGQRMKKGGFRDLTGWKSSDAIRRGKGAINVLTMYQKGRHFEFFVNGTRIDRIPAVTLEGYSLGFQVWHQQTIAVDQVRVLEYDLPKLPPKPDDRLRAIFHDDFQDNRTGWAVQDNDLAAMNVSQGVYRFAHRRDKDSWVSYKRIGHMMHRDFRIETTLRKIDGTNQQGYGLLFGRRDKRNDYRFLISGTGYYELSEVRNGTYRSLTGWMPSSSIRKGNRADNTLAVEQYHDTWFLFINGEPVDRVKKPRGRARRLGPEVGFLIFDRQSIEVDALRIWETEEWLDVPAW